MKMRAGRCSCLHVKPQSPTLSSIILLLSHSQPSFLILMTDLHRRPCSWLKSYNPLACEKMQIFTGESWDRDGAKNGAHVPNMQRSIFDFNHPQKHLKPGGANKQQPKHTHHTPSTRSLQKADRYSLLWDPGSDRQQQKVKTSQSEGRRKQETPSAGWDVIQRKKQLMCNILNT